MTEEELKLDLLKKQTIKMKVSSQIIEHLSKGLYDNPLKAIRELISNSYDADALRVTIRARPRLKRISIADDGSGMNYNDFQENFVWISRSNKRDSGDRSSTLNRPVIGRIGIGFVSASIVCNKMTVISSKKGEAFRFEAVIDFAKFRRLENRKKDFYELAEVELTNHPEEKGAHYTVVILDELDQGFCDQLMDKDFEVAGLRLHDFSDLNFDEIVAKVNELAEKKNFDLEKEVGAYWRLLIDLGNTIPVSYMSSGPIKNSEVAVNASRFKKTKSLIQEIKEEVAKLMFTVDFDGVLLKKPILLPNSSEISIPETDYDLWPIEYSKDVAGSHLKFKGYLYSQRMRIKPAQFRGIIVRVRNTAVGEPDANFLNYLYNEKMYLGWTFGEIYVEEGLEEAMNINRNSFTTTHPHYRALRGELHRMLHSEVFPRTRSRYSDRRKLEARSDAKLQTTKMIQFLKAKTGVEYKIERSSRRSDVPISADSAESTITIYETHVLFKKREGAVLENPLILFEAARLAGKKNLDEILAVYYHLLSEWYSVK